MVSLSRYGGSTRATVTGVAAMGTVVKGVVVTVVDVIGMVVVETIVTGVSTRVVSSFSKEVVRVVFQLFHRFIW